MDKHVQKQAITEWSDRYLDVLEMLYGSFNLHPDFSIEGMCQQWQDQFMTDKEMTAIPQNDFADWEKPYLQTLETIYGSMFVQPDLSIDEINLEWLNLFRQDHFNQATLKKVA